MVLTSDADLPAVCDITNELNIKVVVIVGGTPDVCQPCIEITLVLICHCVIVDMHKEEEKLSVLDPISSLKRCTVGSNVISLL